MLWSFVNLGSFQVGNCGIYSFIPASAGLLWGDLWELTWPLLCLSTRSEYRSTRGLRKAAPSRLALFSPKVLLRGTIKSSSRFPDTQSSAMSKANSQNNICPSLILLAGKSVPKSVSNSKLQRQHQIQWIQVQTSKWWVTGRTTMFTYLLRDGEGKGLLMHPTEILAPNYLCPFRQLWSSFNCISIWISAGRIPHLPILIFTWGTMGPWHQLEFLASIAIQHLQL